MNFSNDLLMDFWVFKLFIVLKGKRENIILRNLDVFWNIHCENFSTLFWHANQILNTDYARNVTLPYFWVNSSIILSHYHLTIVILQIIEFTNFLNWYLSTLNNNNWMAHNGTQSINPLTICIMIIMHEYVNKPLWSIINMCTQIATNTM